MRQMHCTFSCDRLNEPASFLVQTRIHRMRSDGIKIRSDRANVFRDRPFVVIEHDDEALRLRLGVIKRFVTDATGESGVARHHYHMFVIGAAQITTDCHA